MATRYVACEAFHRSQECQDLVIGFHERHAKYPPQRIMGPAKDSLTRIIGMLRRELRDVASRIEFAGSSYEDIKVMTSDLEFDCMVILKGGASLVKYDETTPVGYSRIRVADGRQFYMGKLQNDQGYVSSQLVSCWFFGELQKAVNSSGLKPALRLRAHGPAVQMDVYDPKNKSKVWYSVDMVPALELGQPDQKEIYVAKPKKDAEVNGELYITWRRSFSLEEKEIIKNIDQGNGCRKNVIRLLKVIREKESPLRSLPSYFIKTIVISMNRDEPRKNWDFEHLAKRLVDVLYQLRSILSKGYLPHHFLPALDLLEGYQPKVLFNMVTRIDNLLNSEREMRKLLQS